jgi:uncharacterized protein (DUF849 family)
MKSMDKVIIQVRLNEGVMREDSPHVPYSPREIADQAIECWRAGASIVHYHAREPVTGAKSSDIGLYAEALRLIKGECDIVTFPTLGAAMLPTAEQRMAHIVEMARDRSTKPDMIPVDMLTTNFAWYDSAKREFVGRGDQIYLNTTDMLRYLCEKSREVGVKPMAMLWNVPSIRLTEAFLEMGIYDEPLVCEFPLYDDHMRAFGHPSTIKGMYSLYEFIPPGANWIWLVNAHGANAFPIMAAAMELGGHPTVGVADYAYPELGFPTNAQLVARVADLARSQGREVATAREARAMMGLPGL